ncbi:MAG: hypothetical protein OK439_05055 [Thaumarchaeota archaeon]|nr:hypothetical protein [Nitrososphaerota archaeon]
MSCSTLTADPGIIIAKRSLSLSKTYVVVGAFLGLVSVLISSVPSLLSAFPSTSGIPITSGNFTAGFTFQEYFRLISVPLQVFATLAFTTPVLLLFVYDKNNGVLEYFLSLGMNQGDIYIRYLKAALLLTSLLLGFEIISNTVVGLVEGANLALLLELSGLVVLIALPVVAFVTTIMVAFSSLQKQRIGSNQPLGIATGVFMVFPAYIGPLAIPSLAIPIDLALSLTAIVLTVVMFFLSSKLISREKLLP